MKTLSGDQFTAILNYLFSGNGIMAPRPTVKQQAALLFLNWYKELKGK